MQILKLTSGRMTPDAFWARVLLKPGAASATPDLIKALNAHIDFDRELPANAVLVIPDAADLKAGAGSPVGGDELHDFIASAEAALKAIGAGAAAAFKQADADHAAVAAALKPAAAKRLVESDPELKKRLDAADAQYKADQKRAKDTQSQITAMLKQAPAELERLRKMLAG
jgi:hypothetical protein